MWKGEEIIENDKIQIFWLICYALRNDNLLYDIATLRSQRRIATLPSAARNDNFFMKMLRPCRARNDI